MDSVVGAVAAISVQGGFNLLVLFGIAQDSVGIHNAAFMLLCGEQAVCL